MNIRGYSVCGGAEEALQCGDKENDWHGAPHVPTPPDDFNDNKDETDVGQDLFSKKFWLLLRDTS